MSKFSFEANIKSKVKKSRHTCTINNSDKITIWKQYIDRRYKTSAYLRPSSFLPKRNART